jgi:hypothetical protein
MTNAYYTTPTDVAAGAKVRSIDLNTIDSSIDTAFDKLPTETNIKQGKVNYAVDTGAADAYLVSLPHAPASYTDGLHVRFKPTNTNTGAATINVNSLGAKSIKKINGDALSAGDLTANGTVDIYYNSTTGFFYLSSAASAGASATEAAASSTAASSSASAAATSASAAAASASSASTSASAASTSAAAAATSATTATTQASSASTSATNAASSASAASTSSTNAATSESNAANSASSSASSASAAAASAATISLPSIAGNASNMLRAKADESGLEYRPPTQVRSDIGAASLAGNTFTGGQNELKGPDIASAATTMDIWAAAQGNKMTVTGTTATSGLPAAPQAGASRELIAGGAWPLTHGANFILPGSANYTCTAGDIIEVTAITTTQFRLKITKADGTPVVSGAAPALVLLSTVTASNSATVDIETTFDGTYDAYLLVASGAKTSADGAVLQSTMKISGTYDTGNNYKYHCATLKSDASTYAADASGASGSINIMNSGIGNAANEGAAFSMMIFNPSSTALSKRVTWHGSGITAAGLEVCYTGSAHNTGTAALTGIRFFPSSGNIASGTFRLYGLKNS